MTPTFRVWRGALLRVALVLSIPVLMALLQRRDSQSARLAERRAAEREQRAAAASGPRSGDGRIAYVVTPAVPSDEQGARTRGQLYFVAAAISVYILGQAAWWTVRRRWHARQPI